jgi:hypothetical protein
MVLGTIPLFSWVYSSSAPYIVKVFPVPVCPYAKMVPLYPSSTLSKIGRAVYSKTDSCKQSIPKVASKVKSLDGGRLLFSG